MIRQKPILNFMCGVKPIEEHTKESYKVKLPVNPNFPLQGVIELADELGGEYNCEDHSITIFEVHFKAAIEKEGGSQL